MADFIVLVPKKGDGKGRKKNCNKHASNLRRIDRKYKRAKRPAVAGKCGSSFCSRVTGCEPWKSELSRKGP